MIFINLNGYRENASPTIKKRCYIGRTTTKSTRKHTLHLSNYSPICQCLKKYNCLNATYTNILVNNTKIPHTYNNIKKSKIVYALYIKFRQLTINRNNFEASDNILKCLE